jgi:hypothetical protein
MAEGPEFESRQGQDFSPLNVNQIDSEAYPASHPIDTEDSFSGATAAET